MLHRKLSGQHIERGRKRQRENAAQSIYPRAREKVVPCSTWSFKARRNMTESYWRQLPFAATDGRPPRILSPPEPRFRRMSLERIDIGATRITIALPESSLYPGEKKREKETCTVAGTESSSNFNSAQKGYREIVSFRIKCLPRITGERHIAVSDDDSL